MRIAIVTDVPVGYFRVKADPERAVEQAHVPWTLVRATQFHEIVDTTLARAGRWRPTTSRRRSPSAGRAGHRAVVC
jgi:uncharacterized protein YbjT (DUF2867 family)